MRKGSVSIAILSVLLVVLLGIGVLYLEDSPSAESLKRFSSYEELESFLQSNAGTSFYGGFAPFAASTRAVGAVSELATTSAPAGADAVQEISSEDYSTTNIQVMGVDEADIVKNDGKYIYVVSGEKIVIVDAFPAEQAEIISEIELDGRAQEILINGDKLIVFIDDYKSYNSLIQVYDVSDKSNPVVSRDVSVNGSYYDSRMIGDYVYVIVNQPVRYDRGGPVPLPAISSGSTVRTIAAPEIYYSGFPDSAYIFTNIIAINTQNDNEEFTSKTLLMGYSENMYVSPQNIYIVYTKRLRITDYYDRIIDQVIIPVVPLEQQIQINEIRNSDMNENEKMQEVGEVFSEYLQSLNPETAANVMKTVEERGQAVMIQIAKDMERTVIHKISVNGPSIDYVTSGEAPGQTLNQFSMDEFNGNFRIATTTGNWRATSLNHVYVLDPNLNVIGKLEDLASGERIYSVRFMGEKAYMVTFRQIDPLFVIDLSNPYLPQVLGFLKIPGVSDYLHPYDENHIIGVGRDATEEGRMLGMKLSLFDVSDVANPTEVSKYNIGERGTTSEAIYDHKAFLFSRDKNLLVIPVRLAEGGNWNLWHGAYVFNLDLDNGFVLKGRITHANESLEGEQPYYRYDYATVVRRSLYMDNTLYTVSNSVIKMNDLHDLTEINKVELPYEEEIYAWPVLEGVVR